MPKKEEKEKEAGEKNDLSEMSMFCMQVETMIKQGKTDTDSIHKINILKIGPFGRELICNMSYIF